MEVSLGLVTYSEDLHEHENFGASLFLNVFELLRSWIRPFVVRKVFLGVRWLPQRVGYLGVMYEGDG